MHKRRLLSNKYFNLIFFLQRCTQCQEFDLFIGPKDTVHPVQSTNFGFEGAKRNLMNGAMTFFCSFHQNNQIQGNLKIGLLQCYEVIWIHNIDAICNPLGPLRPCGHPSDPFRPCKYFIWILFVAVLLKSVSCCSPFPSSSHMPYNFTS